MSSSDDVQPVSSSSDVREPEQEVRCLAEVSENKKRKVIKDRGVRGSVVSPRCLLFNEEIEISLGNQDTQGQREGSIEILLLTEVKATGDRYSETVDLQRSMSLIIAIYSTCPVTT